MRYTMENPFNPSFGKIPSIFLSRDLLKERIITELNRKNTPFQTSLIYGQRGSGKTTLMSIINEELQASKDWIVIDLVLDNNLLTSLIDQLNQHLMKLKINWKINFMGVELSSASKDKIERSFQSLFEEAVTSLSNHGRKILITIDEVHSTPLLKKLISNYQLLIRKNLDVSLLMAGLPENVSEIQNDDVLTFLLRANRIILNPLEKDTIKSSYKHIFEKAGFSISLETILFMTKATQGFAYAFQLLGYYVWEAARDSKVVTIETVKKILDNYHNDLFRNVYFKIYQDFSKKEKEFVHAMVKTGHKDVKSKELSLLMKKPANYIAVYRRKLIDEQIITSSSYGYVRFQLPAFDEFVTEQLYFEE